MDVTALTTLISNIGFPIAMCVALFWKLDKSEEQHTEEMNKMSEALNNNTLIMTKLAERLGEGDLAK